MENISNVLFWISNGLLVPVIVGLLYFFITPFVIAFVTASIKSVLFGTVISYKVLSLVFQSIPFFFPIATT